MSTEKQTDEIGVKSTIPAAEPGAQEAPNQTIHLHIYDLPPEEAEPQGIESTLTPGEATPLPEWQPSDHQPKQRKWRVLPWALAITFVVLLLIGGSIATVLLFPPSATVTIIPTTKKVQTTNTLILSTHADTPESIPGRVLAAITMSQAETVATTGRTQQEARPGRGTITFYNAGTSAQTIMVGTLITGKDGVQAVTDASVTVPAANYPTFGQATVNAHSIITGPGGNITASDIYGSCCLLNISAVNSAFTGGQDIETYQSVSKQDIETTATKLQASLKEAVTVALATQVQGNETLIAPPMCEAHVSIDHQIGDKATQVQVNVSETCTGLTYDTKMMQARISHPPITKGDLDHYHLLGDARIVVQNITPGKESGTYTLSVQSNATYTHQFSQKELSTITSHIVGKTTSDATRYLLHTAGVQQVSFSSNSNLPSDASNIHFLFLTQQ
jgi:hypothetical protein